MTKKLIALIEVLMVVSLFCTGFASWMISPYTDGNSKTQLGSVSSHAVEIRQPSSYGISLATSDSATGLKAETFRYVMKNGKLELSNLKLSVLLKVTAATLKAAEDYHDTELIITCKVNNIPFDRATRTDSSSEWTDVSGEGDYSISTGSVSGWTATVLPDTCTITLGGYPNLRLYVSVIPIKTVAADGNSYTVDQLQIKIPLDQIYNIISLNKLNTTTSYLKVELEFEPKGTAPQVVQACGLSYSLELSTCGT